MLRYLGYGGQQIEPELSQRIELVVERLELDIEPAACAACLPSMPRAWTSRENPAFAWPAPTLSCEVAISIDISKTPALPRSWHAPSAWTPSVACVPREPNIPWREPCSTPHALPMWKPPSSRWTSRSRLQPPHTDSPATGALVPATATARLRPSARSSMRSTPRGSSGLPSRPPACSCPPKA